jgi:hypothetical protein
MVDDVTNPMIDPLGDSSLSRSESLPSGMSDAAPTWRDPEGRAN